MQLRHPDDSWPKETATTRNLSDGGVCVVTQYVWRPGEAGVLNFPGTGSRVEGRVIYCQKSANMKFAVGLKLAQPMKA